MFDSPTLLILNTDPKGYELWAVSSIFCVLAIVKPITDSKVLNLRSKDKDGKCQSIVPKAQKGREIFVNKIWLFL